MGMRYWGAAIIVADRSLQVVADELNMFLAPLALVETDLFDEVPGYIAAADGLKFELQGPPDDADDKSYYYFNFVCHAEGLNSLPNALGNLANAASLETETAPLRRSSTFLCERLRATTTLVCDAA
ncbi:hypothetical protein ACN9M1_22905 [Ralstonia sp. R-29]|uniref:hypothetical protein n=1 Tax=Ralstonia sp. R-29 TaxID=3404059 RepID=UPI003CED3767